jgi:hypothetical protein
MHLFRHVKLIIIYTFFFDLPSSSRRSRIKRFISNMLIFVLKALFHKFKPHIKPVPSLFFYPRSVTVKKKREGTGLI